MTFKDMNGIDTGKSRAVQELIRGDGEGDMARPEYSADVVWQGGYRTISRMSDGKAIVGDEPVRLGGTGTGMTPQDLLLAAVGQCLVATYIGGLSNAGIEVESLELNVSGRVNFRAAFGLESGNPGFASIRVSVEITTSAPKEKVDRILSRLLPTAPIPDTVIRPVPLDVAIVHGPSKKNGESVERDSVVKLSEQE